MKGSSRLRDKKADWFLITLIASCLLGSPVESRARGWEGRESTFWNDKDRHTERHAI